MYGLVSLVTQMVKNLPAMQETRFQSLGQGDPYGEENGYPPQYSCLEKSIDRGAWWDTVYEVAKSRTQLSDEHFSKVQGRNTKDSTTKLCIFFLYFL